MAPAQRPIVATQLEELEHLRALRAEAKRRDWTVSHVLRRIVADWAMRRAGQNRPERRQR